MAYFANGTENDVFQERYCDRCIHDRKARQDNPENGCPIIALHFIYNYDQLKDSEAGQVAKCCLSALIPRAAPGHMPTCKMFVEDPGTGAGPSADNTSTNKENR